MLKKWIDFWIFSNFHVATIAVVTTFCTQRFFHLEIDFFLLGFIFFATMSSYSLHWALTNVEDFRERNIWNNQHKKLLKTLFLLSFCALFCFFSLFLENVKILLPLGFLTFLYTAPKIPHPFFSKLKNFALGKTFYLAFVWAAVTVLLPLYQQVDFDKNVFFFFINRLLFILPICMLFDYRDRKEDYGIQNLVTYFNEKTINFVFTLQVFLFEISSFYASYNWRLWIPIFVLILLFSKSKQTNNDYWYYGILDSTMMISGFLYLF
jgi:hypothetical protein